MKILTKNNLYYLCYTPIVGDGTIDYQLEEYLCIEDLKLRRNCMQVMTVECFGEWLPEYAFEDVMLALITSTTEWVSAEIVDLNPVVEIPATPTGMVPVPEVTL